MPKIRRIILINDFISSYGRGLLRGIAKYSRLHGPWLFYKMPAVYLEAAWKNRGAELSRIKKWTADGILVHNLQNAQELMVAGVPIITTDDREVFPDIPCIISDYSATGKLVAEYLLNRKFRHFGYFGLDTMFWSKQRQDMFSKAIAAAGCNVHIYPCPKTKANRLWENELPLIEQWLTSLPKPIGVMCCSDNRSHELSEACRAAGIHVPEEVAIVGVDNDELFCDLSNPPLSSVAFNTEKAGYEAAEMLDRLMNHEPVEDTKILVHPTQVVTRHSTDILAIEDEEVAAAVRYIRDHNKESLQVKNVVDSVAVSRRGLERRFRKALGRSIHEEIRRVHIEQVCLMLAQTNLSVTKIAATLGYPNIDNIAHYFKREKGMTPRAYRKLYGGK